MSKPGKSLKSLCKRLKVRLTVKRNGKRVYKSVKVLKAQCARKKKKVKRKKVKRKRRRKFGSGPPPDGYPSPIGESFAWTPSKELRGDKAQFDTSPLGLLDSPSDFSPNLSQISFVANTDSDEEEDFPIQGPPPINRQGGQILDFSNMFGKKKKSKRKRKKKVKNKSR
tara:strand:- start:2056 stop:2559 length:504 start_codon:yes stop_codon:yes gene_type:complete